MIDTLLDLWPSGLLSTRTNSTLYKILNGLSKELSRTLQFVRDARKEVSPQTATSATQTEWIATYNAPNIMLARAYHVAVGGQTKTYLLQQLRVLDSNIDINATTGGTNVARYGEAQTDYGDSSFGEMLQIKIEYPNAWGISPNDPIYLANPENNPISENLQNLINNTGYHLATHLLDAVIYDRSSN